MSQPIIFAQAAPAAPAAPAATPAGDTTHSAVLTSSATGADQPPAEAPPFYTTLIPFLLLLAFFYFAVIRPQQTARKAQEQLLKKLKPGDRAVTSGGILGVISSFEDNETVVVLKVAENTKLRVKRANISEVLNEDTKAKETKETTTEVVKDAPRDLAKNKKSGGPR